METNGMPGKSAGRRLLHLYKDCHPVKGGIENHLTELSRAQAALGHDVTVLVAGPAGRRTEVTQEEGVTVVRAKRLATLASTPLSPAFFREAGRLSADIAHLHYPHPPGEIAWLWKRPAPHAVLAYHCDVVRQKNIMRFYGPLLRRVLSRVDRITVNNPTQMDLPLLAPFLHKCSVVPLGIDITPFSPPTPEQHTASRRALTLPEKSDVLLFMGVLRYYKGLGTLIEAMARLPERVTLLVGGDGPMRQEWEKAAQRSPAAERIRFLGRVPDERMATCYHAADVFVLPSNSRAEAYGLVQIEAMACGVPSVCTEVGTGTSWVNLHGETGIVVPPCDPEELGDALLALLNEPDRRRAMGLAARKRVETHFTTGIMVQGYERVYEQIGLATQKSAAV